MLYYWTTVRSGFADYPELQFCLPAVPSYPHGLSEDFRRSNHYSLAEKAECVFDALGNLESRDTSYDIFR